MRDITNVGMITLAADQSKILIVAGLLEDHYRKIGLCLTEFPSRRESFRFENPLLDQL